MTNFEVLFVLFSICALSLRGIWVNGKISDLQDRVEELESEKRNPCADGGEAKTTYASRDIVTPKE